jgi:hypothetical protein
MGLEPTTSSRERVNADPLPGHLLAHRDKGSRLACSEGFARAPIIEARRDGRSPCLTSAADVPAMHPRVARSDDKKCLFAGISSKPSDGLEPSTPSLPWRFGGGTGGHGRASAITFFLQMDASRYVARIRVCPRVPELMYPSRTRGLLSVFRTVYDLGSGERTPGLS